MHKSSSCAAGVCLAPAPSLALRFASVFRQAFLLRWRRRHALPAMPDQYHAELERLGVRLRPIEPPSVSLLRLPPP
ncbi:hypothetical protein SAMN02745746_00461 [Pseudogulbenkiania subflava DSM 22618]|uniref:Uncharacterized protein n=1 Tax=Pseudogulbenkiania subflava DSM 22618 TaxID=1123014 RepID=A0A1Y6B9B1_9NEIS|nr:hypothetical protein SAMN02745746_00461 [Pseudogulbenkiania subflava DSM 22618]